MNLICVVMDTARRDRLGCYAYPRETSPSIDQFARQSLVFDKMITPGPWTIPSHGSLLTGLYPREHGAHYPTPMLRSDTVTLAEHLSQCGYITCCVSNNGLLGRASNLTRGFERVLRRRDYDVRSRRLRKLRDVLGLPDSGAAAANRRIRTLLRTLARPFFLFVNYMECHWPYTPPWGLERRFVRARQRPLTSTARRLRMIRSSSWNAIADAANGEREILCDLYDAEVACLDARVGELLECVAEARLEDETMIILTSDHGEHLGEHGLADHQGSLYQTLIHVPFLARIPGVPPQRVPGLAQFTDVFAGVCHVLGLPVPETLRHRWGSVDPFGRNGGRPHAFAEWHHWGPGSLAALQRKASRFDFRRTPGHLEAVQDHRYKLIVETATDRSRLFDVSSDPDEEHDLSTVRPEEASRLRAALNDWRDACPEFAGTFTPDEEQAVERRLRDLGYL